MERRNILEAASVLSLRPFPHSGSVEPGLGEGSEFSGCLYFQFFLFTLIKVMSFKATVCWVFFVVDI